MASRTVAARTAGSGGSRVGAVGAPAATGVSAASRVGGAISKVSFAVLNYVTPAGEPRSSGVVCGTAGRRLYVATAPYSWKARHISDGDQVAVTLPPGRLVVPRRPPSRLPPSPATPRRSRPRLAPAFPRPGRRFRHHAQPRRSRGRRHVDPGGVGLSPHPSPALYLSL